MVGDFFGLGLIIVLSAIVSCFATSNPIPLLGMLAALYALSFAGSHVEKTTKRK
jgi:hypothetical protein